MTSQSPRIYTYKITFEEVPYYYYGVHKEKRFNEYYMGSPYTHKWVWNLYTPKKQILEIFDYNDEGWVEAQEVEKRLIKPIYNKDKWCLNESCGGKVSLKILSENGKIMGKINGKKHRELGTGFFKLSTEERRENGKKRGNERKMEKSGVCGRSKEKMSEDGRIAGKKAYETKVGIHKLTSEQKSEAGRKGGKISAIKNIENKVGIFSLTKEQLSENSKKANSQKWMCLETGYITNSGALSMYQKARNIDTSKRKRIE
jgi:hypothetical protein